VETVTIYTCECGAKHDDPWLASVHFVKCRGRWSERKLTPDEHEAWKQGDLKQMSNEQKFCKDCASWTRDKPSVAVDGWGDCDTLYVDGGCVSIDKRRGHKTPTHETFGCPAHTEKEMPFSTIPKDGSCLLKLMFKPTQESFSVSEIRINRLAEWLNDLWSQK